MCFSANASFGASVVLGIIGIVSIIKARSVPQRLFAMIPLMFSVQQLSEGMLWLSLKDPVLAEWQSFFTYTFLIFAMVVWPIWVPLTIRLLEKDARLKKIMNIIIVIGVAVAASVASIMWLYPVRVIPSHHHLHYHFELPQVVRNLLWIFTMVYFIVTTLTPFISRIKNMKWLGIIFLVSYLLGAIFFNDHLVSVWCYLAALLSIIVLWIIMELRKQDTVLPQTKNFFVMKTNG